jgi:cellulose synthase/poly-beta-1,6-N-acetylglucosamine synthase-like glycosyltransferase
MVQNADAAALTGAQPTTSPVEPEEIDVSVLIPVRNGMPYFSEQLAALARQTYSGSWEVIVSDNGSTDDSAEAARAAAGAIPLKLIDASDVTGKGETVGKAARIARGRFLLHCDADDLIADDWVERMAAALDKYPAVGGHLDDVSLNPDSVHAWRPPSTPGELPRPFGLLPTVLGGNCGFQREVWEKVGGYDATFRGSAAEETDLSWRIQLAGYEITYVPDAVISYRHQAGLSALLRQWRSYGRGRAHLVARYQALGLLPAESWRDVIATIAWLVLHSVDCLRGATRRARYLRMAAHVAGQVKGSRETGVLHLSLRGPRQKSQAHGDGSRSKTPGAQESQ